MSVPPGAAFGASSATGMASFATAAPTQMGGHADAIAASQQQMSMAFSNGPSVSGDDVGAAMSVPDASSFVTDPLVPGSVDGSVAHVDAMGDGAAVMGGSVAPMASAGGGVDPMATLANSAGQSSLDAATAAAAAAAAAAGTSVPAAASLSGAALFGGGGAGAGGLTQAASHHVASFGSGAAMLGQGVPPMGSLANPGGAGGADAVAAQQQQHQQHAFVNVSGVPVGAAMVPAAAALPPAMAGASASAGKGSAVPRGKKKGAAAGKGPSREFSTGDRAAMVKTVLEQAATSFQGLAEMTALFAASHHSGTSATNLPKWSDAEVAELKQLIARFGDDVKRLADKMKTRSAKEIRNKAKKLRHEEAAKKKAAAEKRAAAEERDAAEAAYSQMGARMQSNAVQGYHHSGLAAQQQQMGQVPQGQGFVGGLQGFDGFGSVAAQQQQQLAHMQQASYAQQQHQLAQQQAGVAAAMSHVYASQQFAGYGGAEGNGLLGFQGAGGYHQPGPAAAAAAAAAAQHHQQQVAAQQHHHMQQQQQQFMSQGHAAAMAAAAAKQVAPQHHQGELDAQLMHSADFLELAMGDGGTGGAM